MVSSKNRNYHRNYGCNLVEITFKAIGIGARHTPPKHTRFTHAGFSRIVAACDQYRRRKRSSAAARVSLPHDSAARFLVKVAEEAQTEQ